MQFDLHRTFDAKLLNALVNHSDIRPTIEQGDDYIDTESVVTNPENIVLACSMGAALFIPEAKGVYKGHILVLAPYRGKAALWLAREALKQVFLLYKAEQIVASVSLVLPAARYLCRAVGFTPLGVCSATGVEQFKMEESQWADL